MKIKVMIHERRKHTWTILTSCIASLTDLAGAKFGTNIAGAALEPEGCSAPLTEAFVLTENSEVGWFPLSVERPNNCSKIKG